MKFHKITALFLGWTLLNTPVGLSLTSVEGSAEDIYWSAPMTVHDYKKNTDLHNVALSSLSITELEFVRLGDGLFNFTMRNNKSPISRSMDAVEYAYSQLPQIKPVRRFAQLWDALQLRQLSLADARVASSILFADPYGGITSMMQVRANKLIIFVEDTIYDIDSAVMSPFNWSLSFLQNKPVKIKSLGFAADGLDVLRTETFKILNYIDHKLVKFGSDTLFGIKKVQDNYIRHKRKKKHGRLLVYAKMPLAVFLENQSHFRGKKKTVFVGTLEDWHARFYQDPHLLPDNIRKEDFLIESLPVKNLSQEVILAAEYATWGKTPRHLKKYVITADETIDAIRQYSPPSLSNNS